MTLRARPGRPERKESCVYYTQGNPGANNLWVPGKGLLKMASGVPRLPQPVTLVTKGLGWQWANDLPIYALGSPFRLL